MKRFVLLFAVTLVLVAAAPASAGNVVTLDHDTAHGSHLARAHSWEENYPLVGFTMTTHPLQRGILQWSFACTGGFTRQASLSRFGNYVRTLRVPTGQGRCYLSMGAQLADGTGTVFILLTAATPP